MTDLNSLLAGKSGSTKDFEFVRGEYAISGERVPYFAISMTVNEAVSHLRLARDLAVDAEDPINLEELMQRDVSNLRSEEGIAQYLRSPTRLKFFNSLTVVLMPLSAGGGPQMAFPANQQETTSPDSEGLEVTHVGPVKLRQLQGRGFGFISWETSATAAVIIDGQHRFLALQKVRNDTPQLLMPDVTTLPVLLLVLDPRAGFKAVEGGPQGIVKASRAIFTDINKYAVKVSPEREYLLDDLSVTAVAMRQILTPGIGGTSAKAMDHSPARIPLAVVDWIRPRQTKFDDGPYITSIQALHQLVTEVIQAPAPSGTAYEGLATWLDKLSSRLEIGPDAWNMSAIRGRLAAAEEQELPFSLNDGEVQAAGSAFSSTLGQVIVGLLLGGQPYRELIDGYLQAGLLGTRKELWLGQNQHARLAYEAQFNEFPAVEAAEIIERVKGKYPLAYLVVFQRGLIVAAMEVAQVSPQLSEAWEMTEGSQNEVFKQWISRFNTYIAPTLGNSHFWAGTAVEATGEVNFAQTSKKAIMGLALLLTLPSPDESSTQPRRGDAQLLTGDPRDADLQLLDGDQLVISTPTPEQIRCVATWRELLEGIAPGPAVGGELGKLRRTAARAYRAGLRRHVGQIAQVRGRELTDDVRDRLVLAHGSRRLAFVIQ